MDRAEFARQLGAPTSHVREAAPAPVRVEAADPTEFMRAFTAAAAGGGEVFLCDPRWTEAERAQVPAAGSQRSNRPSQMPAAASARAGWLMIPTGGTSGRIRFARHDEDTVAAAVAGFAQHFGVSRVNCAGVLPLHHVSGFMAWMRSALTGGEYLPLDWKRLEAGALAPLPARPEGWFLSLVPTQLERLLRAPAAVEWLRGFRTIFLGGAPAWPALLERAAAAQLPLSPSYGMTETAAMVTALQPHEFLLGARSSGAALPHAVVTIDAGGTIRVGGPSLFRGYWPELRAERWFDTQDRGELDARGQLRVLGRRDEVIVSGGEKIDPQDVEAALRATGEFADVAVVGLPHPEWGSEVVAVFARQDSPDIAKVRAVLERTLAAYKRPKRYLALADWPRTETGKLARDALRAAALGES